MRLGWSQPCRLCSVRDVNKSNPQPIQFLIFSLSRSLTHTHSPPQSLSFSLSLSLTHTHTHTHTTLPLLNSLDHTTKFSYSAITCLEWQELFFAHHFERHKLLGQRKHICDNNMSMHTCTHQRARERLKMRGRTKNKHLELEAILLRRNDLLS